MNRQILSVLIVGVLAIAATIWFTYPDSSTFISDPSKYKFMYCPKCGRELKFDIDTYAKGCPRDGTELVPTEQSIAVTGKPNSPWAKTIVWILVELIAVMGAIVFLTHRRRSDGEAEYFYINCEKCRQRIRYREQQVGLAAMCRRCRHAFVYPEAEVH